MHLRELRVDGKQLTGTADKLGGASLSVLLAAGLPVVPSTTEQPAREKTSLQSPSLSITKQTLEEQIWNQETCSVRGITELKDRNLF